MVKQVPEGRFEPALASGTFQVYVLDLRYRSGLGVMGLS